jgi:hypothetical protein
MFQRFCVFIGLVVGVMMGSGTALGQFVHNGMLETARLNYQPYSISNGGYSGAIEYVDPFGFAKRGSAGIIGNFWDEQDQRFYTWGATNAHNFAQGGLFATGHTLVTGLNTINDRGQEFSVAEYFLHPGYTNIGGNQPDVALFRLNVALPISNITIAQGNVGDILTYASFGRQGTPATGLLTFDGYGRAFEGRIDAFGSGPAGVADFYTKTTFYPPGHSLFNPLGGMGTGGGSGSFGYNANGELVSLLALVSGGSPSYFGDSYGVHLSDPYIANWWNATLPPAVPAPGAIAIFGIGGFLAAGRRRRRAA